MEQTPIGREYVCACEAILEKSKGWTGVIVIRLWELERRGEEKRMEL